MAASFQSAIKSIVQHLFETLAQIILLSIVVLVSFVISFYLRQLETRQVLLTPLVWELILSWSLSAGITATILYKVGRLTLLNILALFFPRQGTENKANKLVSFLFSLYLATAFIITTQPLRPVLQHTQVEAGDEYVDVAYVRYDFVPTLVILLVLAIPTVILSKKRNSPPEFFTTTALMVFFGGLALYSNLSPNFQARVYEARESWILRDWNGQALRAEKAYQDAESAEEKANALYWLGVAANRNKNYHQAIEYQLEAITLQPDYGAPYSSISTAYRALGNYSLAFEYAQQCIERVPDYAWCYYALGSAQAETGAWDEAVQSFTKATQLDSRDEELKTALTATLNQVKQMDADDRIYSQTPPPGCSAVPIVDAAGQRCTGKNIAKRLSYTGSADCLTIRNTNCHGAGVEILNNCPSNQAVFFNEYSVAKGESKMFQLGNPRVEEIVYAVGTVGDEHFVVSYTQTTNLCL